MNDPNTPDPNPLEQELRQFQPRAISPDVVTRLGNALTASNPRPSNPIPHTPYPTSDRCLLTALSLGALAACVILTLSISDFTSAPPSSPAPIVRQLGEVPQTRVTYQQFLAQLDLETNPLHRPH